MAKSKDVPLERLNIGQVGPFPFPLWRSKLTGYSCISILIISGNFKKLKPEQHEISFFVDMLGPEQFLAFYLTGGKQDSFSSKDSYCLVALFVVCAFKGDFLSMNNTYNVIFGEQMFVFNFGVCLLNQCNHNWGWLRCKGMPLLS